MRVRYSIDASKVKEVEFEDLPRIQGYDFRLMIKWFYKYGETNLPKLKENMAQVMQKGIIRRRLVRRHKDIYFYLGDFSIRVKANEIYLFCDVR